MGAPRVTIGELDLTSRVPSFPGVTIGIVVPAIKGNALEAFLVTNESSYLSQATPDETVKVGDDLGHYSAIAALAGTNRMWVARAQNSADTGGIVLASHAPSWSASTVYALGARVLPTTPDGFVYEATVAGTSSSSEPTFPSSIGGTVVDNTVTWTQVSARIGNFAIPVAYANPTLDYDFGSSATVWIASTSYAAGDKVTPLGTPNGFYYTTIAGGQSDSAEPTFPTAAIGDTVSDGAVVWVLEGTLDDDAVLIYGSNPGAWNKAIGIKVFSNAASPTVVKTAGAFHIQVFNGNTQVENGTGNNGFVVSRVTGAKDGFGQGIFVDDKLDASNYIRGMSNVAIQNTVTVNEQSTNLKMTVGSDGSAVTDTQMISAAKFLENTAKFPLTVLCDAGFATAAYGTELDRIASARGDSIAILSTPFATEDASDYITQITDYRNSILNLNSSWSALYTPHCKIRDKFNDRDIFVAPDGYIASIISKTASTFDLWLPPAGFDDRAKIPVVDLRRRFTEGEMDTLYDNEVNPILFEPGEGIMPWGQKTQLSSPSSLDRVNVRLLLLVIEPAVKLAMKSFLFKLNTASTRALAQGRIESFLQGIASAPIPGIVPGTSGQPAFRAQADLENNLVSDIENNRMVVWVFLRPALSVEEIPVTIALLNPGAELSLGI